ncbi:mCG147767 [Mus musculus]|nr:mCG147767 [Mus musculus]
MERRWLWRGPARVWGDCGLHGGVALWMIRSPFPCVPHTQLVLSIDLLVDGTSVMSSQVRNMP